MTVAVVVPLALRGCEHRERAWEWVRTKCEEEHPAWPVVTGTVDGAWSKGAAVADALRRTDADTLIISDADVWSDDLAVCVESRTRRWATPHSTVYRFNERATETILEGVAPFDVAQRRGVFARPPYEGKVGGGIVVIDRALYDECPLDPRFSGWGGEDEAWGYALATIAGQRDKGRGAVWHLWHPPADRVGRNGSDANETLLVRYQHAGGDDEAMRALIEEGRRWLSMTSSSHR